MNLIIFFEKALKLSKNGGEKKDFILVQELEQSWSNTNINNQIETQTGSQTGKDKKNSGSGLILHRKSKSSITSMFFNSRQRTKSLCVSHNTTLFSYAASKAIAAAKEKKKISMSSSTNQKFNSNKELKILQNHEKILEIQNKWTGNGKFIIKAKSTFLVNIFVFFLPQYIPFYNIQ